MTRRRFVSQMTPPDEGMLEMTFAMTFRPSRVTKVTYEEAGLFGLSCTSSG